MTLIANYVAGPYHGVSQAPPQDRLPDACEVMEDCTATIPNGIQRRPPFKLLGTMPGFLIGQNPVWHDVPRGSPQTDVILLLNNEGGVIQPHLIQAATGTSIPLTVTTAARAYLALNSPTKPNQQFRACSVEDFTFITNRTVQVLNSSATNTARNPEALLWVKFGQYGRTYSASLNGGTCAYTTPAGNTASDALWVDTQVILNELYKWGASPTIAAGAPGNGLPTADGSAFSGTVLMGTSGFTFTVTGSTLHIQSTSATDFTISTSDGSGDSSMYAIKGSIQEFSMLPIVGFPGMIVRIAQSAAGGNSDFYVQYSNTGASPVGGVWTECLAPGAPLGLDPTTMPIALTVNESTGVWTLDSVAWKGRTTGDANLSPDPGFIGDYITDIQWWRGRLALIYNGGVTLSASNDPFRFYTTTLATALDSDPIGFLTPADRKTFFKQAITFDQRFFVLGDRVQAAITSGLSAVTPSTTTINVMAESAFSDLSRVQKGNHKVRYLANRASSAIVYLLAIDRLSGLALEEDKSAAIPQYIPQTIDCASTWEADYMTVWGTSGTADLYVASYREEQYQEVQNAYYRWHTPPGFTLGGFFFKEGVLLCLIQDALHRGYFCTLDTTQNLVTQGRDATVSLIPQFADLMLDDVLVIENSATSANTFLTLPFSVAQVLQVSLRAPWGGYPEGYLIQVASQIDTALILKGDWLGAPLWFGIAYASYFIPSQWYYAGQDHKPQQDGRLSMKRLKIDLANWGYLRAEVSVVGRATRITAFEGYLQDDPLTPIDSPPNRETAVLMVPLAGNAPDVQVKFIADSNFGFKFVGYEWKADWNPRSRRVT